MKNQQSTSRLYGALCAAGLLTCTLATEAQAEAMDTAATAESTKVTTNARHFKGNKRMVVRGVAVTGFNRLYGEPVSKLGSYGDFGYETIAVHNGAGAQPAPLLANTDDDALVATVVDSGFLVSHGLKSLSEIPADLINVPLRAVGMNGFLDGLTYATRPDELTHAPFQSFSPSQSTYEGDVTVEDWMSAKGHLKFVCRSNGTAKLKMKFRHLIPHRMYSVWGFFDKEEAMPFANFGPIRPLAGLPNMVVSTDDGRGSFERELNFCPMKLKGDEVELSAVFLNYHSDVEMHGGVLSFTDYDRYPGTVTHTQLYFPLSNQ